MVKALLHTYMYGKYLQCIVSPLSNSFVCSEPAHLFLSISGDAGPLVLLNAVSPEVSQVLRAVPATKQVHGLCREQTSLNNNNNKLQLNNTEHLHLICIPLWNQLNWSPSAMPPRGSAQKGLQCHQRAMEHLIHKTKSNTQVKNGKVIRLYIINLNHQKHAWTDPNPMNRLGAFIFIFIFILVTYLIIFIILTFSEHMWELLTSVNNLVTRLQKRCGSRTQHMMFCDSLPLYKNICVVSSINKLSSLCCESITGWVKYRPVQFRQMEVVGSCDCIRALCRRK